MFTCLNSAPSARSAATVCAENPHCGKSGVPFMNSTTGAEPSSVLILSTTSIRALPHCLASLGELGQQAPLLRRAHRQPAPDLLTGAQASDAVSPLVERADVDARGRRTLRGLHRTRVRTAVTHVT